MKDFRWLIVTIVLGLGLALALPVLQARADPGARYVETTGSDADNDCTDPGNPCATLQHAIDVADPGDEIRVAGGAYTRVGTLAVITKELSIIGGYAADFGSHGPALYETVLDAGWGGPVISIINASDVTQGGSSHDDDQQPAGRQPGQRGGRRHAAVYVGSVLPR